MQVLAGSLNIEVGEFLHAGYLSAYPRTFDRQPGSSAWQGPVEVIDVGQALELKEAVPQVLQPSSVRAPAPARMAPRAAGISEVFSLVIVFVFFTYLISLYCRRVQKIARPGLKPWLLASAAMAVIICVMYGFLPAYEDYRIHAIPAPWRDVPIQEYRDPQTATLAIYHALIANAILGCPVTAKSLAAVQEEVAFPVEADEYTPGMAYAQKTYGRDGWGRDFRFVRVQTGQYHVTSAGPDGKYDTDDDLVFVTPTGEWESRVKGLYIRTIAGKHWGLLHRVDDGHFRFARADEARKLTGSELFDMVPLYPAWQDRDRPVSPLQLELQKREKAVSAASQAKRLLFARRLDQKQ